MKSISVRCAPRQRQFAVRNLHGNRHEIFRAVQLKVIQLHRQRDFGHRIFQHQRVFELPFLVGGRELRELFVGEIALAVGELARDSSGERYLDAMEASVGGRVRAVIADDVVARD